MEAQQVHAKAGVRIRSESETLEKRLAGLWLRSVHCKAAIHSLAWRKEPTAALRDAIAVVSEVPGVSEDIVARIDAERGRLMRKGYVLPA